jgi:hypothetical protein
VEWQIDGKASGPGATEDALIRLDDDWRPELSPGDLTELGGLPPVDT